jgi:DNA-binding CsgD family transcriptional regulator
MTAKRFHDVGGVVCSDEMAELRSVLNGEMLTPRNSGLADVRDRWGTMYEARPVEASPAESAETSAFSVSRFARAWSREESAEERQTPISIVPGRVEPNRRPDLLIEIERFVAAGQPELAAERLLSAILTAGLAAALSVPAPAAPEPVPIRPSAASPLTRREGQVAKLIAEGLTNRSIADALFISPSTVERHVANIFNKLGCHSRVQIAAWTLANGPGAVRLGLVS